jgi:hypothetical protein
MIAPKLASATFGACCKTSSPTRTACAHTSRSRFGLPTPMIFGSAHRSVSGRRGLASSSTGTSAALFLPGLCHLSAPQAVRPRGTVPQALRPFRADRLAPRRSAALGQGAPVATYGAARALPPFRRLCARARARRPARTPAQPIHRPPHLWRGRSRRSGPHLQGTLTCACLTTATPAVVSADGGPGRALADLRRRRDSPGVS